ncbi:MAG TPA: acyltransferase [bacterium]|jgi:peptidoglycan/LPS O-acetylase OafA/YrhL|nr:acyltransferase [bacterium]
MAMASEVHKRRFLTLDGLRGLGALLIMVFHFGSYGISPVPMFCKGYLAVDLFFILSGVVLAEAYSARLAAGLSLAEFLKIRWIRLYPFYALALVSSVAMLLLYFLAKSSNMDFIHWAPTRFVAGFTPGSFLVAFSFSAFMVPAPIAGALFPFVVQAWSLFYELLVNLGWALTRAGLGRFRLGIVIAIAACGLCMFGHNDGIAAGGEWTCSDLATGCCRVSFSFGVGLMIHDIDKARVPRVNPWIIFLVVVALLAANPPEAWWGLFDLAAVWVFLPACVLLATVSEPRHAWEAQTFTFMGNASYGIYMIHGRFLSVLHWAVDRFALSPYLGEVLVTVGVVFLAHWLERVWDRPARSWLAGFIGGESAPKLKKR